MEKISGILPSSSRLAAVDLKESAPVRPGVPTFGRTSGVSGPRDVPKETGHEKSAHNGVDWHTKDMQQAALAKEVSSKFFINNRSSPNIGRNDSGMHAMQVPINQSEGLLMASSADSAARGTSGADPSVVPLHTEGLDDLSEHSAPGSFHPEVSFDDKEDLPGLRLPEFFAKSAGTAGHVESARKQPEGLYPKGSFIDRSA